MATSTEAPYNVRYSFTVPHYGNPDQIEGTRKWLERQIELATSRPVILQVSSVVQVDLAEEEEAKEGGEEEE